MNHRKPKSSFPGILVRILIIFIALGIFGYGAYNMFFYVADNKESDQGRDVLAQQSLTILTPDELLQQAEKHQTGTTPSGDKKAPDLSQAIPIRVDFEALQAEYPHIIGWIYCADTPINYPIVQAHDNQYYVDRLVDGTPNGAGAIFMDFRNNPDFSDLNTIIYGHNMTNKSMFGSLRDYRNQSYYDQFPSLWIVTPETAYRVDLVAGCVTAADSDDYDLLDQKEDLQALLKELMGRSTFKSNINPNVVNHLVVLSPCTYEYDNARYIVVGSLLPIPYPDEFTEASSGNDLTK